MIKPKAIEGPNRNNYAKVYTYPEWKKWQVSVEIHTGNPKFIKEVAKFLLKSADYIEEKNNETTIST